MIIGEAFLYYWLESNVMGFVGKVYSLAFQRAPLRFCMISEARIMANLKIPVFNNLVAENI